MLTTKTTFYILAPVAIFVAGCATRPATNEASAEVDRQILESAQKVQRAQLALAQAGAINELAPKRDEPIADDKQRISLTWQGDAAQLLEKLARDRGLSLVVLGVKLPLPINVNLKDSTVDNALEIVQLQVGYRAVITRTSERVVLHFNRPQL